VDLAGSERANRAKTAGERMKEASKKRDLNENFMEKLMIFKVISMRR